jgi:hypothetical protein
MIAFILDTEPAAVGNADPVNALFAGFGVLSRSRSVDELGAWRWSVTLDAALTAGQKTSLRAALESSGHCSAVMFL